jgi:hypothetical protein
MERSHTRRQLKAKLKKEAGREDVDKYYFIYFLVVPPLNCAA